AKNRSVWPAQDAIDCHPMSVRTSRTSMTTSEASDGHTRRAFRRDCGSPTSTIFPRCQKSTQCAPPIGLIGEVDMSAAEALAGGGQALAGGPVGPGLDRLALAPGVAGDTAHRHLDPETGRSALLLRLAAPEPVLPVVPGPGPARLHDRARVADGAGLGLADLAGLRPFPRGSEEDGCVPVADRVRHPGRTARHRCGRQHGHDRLLQGRPGEFRREEKRRVGGGWGGPVPRPVLLCPNPITAKQSKKELILDVCNLLSRYDRQEGAK